jgi:hypothetical protein
LDEWTWLGFEKEPGLGFYVCELDFRCLGVMGIIIEFKKNYENSFCLWFLYVILRVLYGGI